MDSHSYKGTLCAGDTHLWLDSSSICSCGQKWQRTYRLHGGWGENLLVLAGEVGQVSASRGLAWLLDITVHITRIIGSIENGTNYG